MYVVYSICKYNHFLNISQSFASVKLFKLILFNSINIEVTILKLSRIQESSN